MSRRCRRRARNEEEQKSRWPQRRKHERRPRNHREACQNRDREKAVEEREERPNEAFGPVTQEAGHAKSQRQPASDVWRMDDQWRSNWPGSASSRHSVVSIREAAGKVMLKDLDNPRVLQERLPGSLDAFLIVASGVDDARCCHLLRYSGCSSHTSGSRLLEGLPCAKHCTSSRLSWSPVRSSHVAERGLSRKGPPRAPKPRAPRARAARLPAAMTWSPPISSETSSSAKTRWSCRLLRSPASARRTSMSCPAETIFSAASLVAAGASRADAARARVRIHRQRGW